MPLQPNTHPTVTRYTVTSNDVISDELRINIAHEGTGRVRWYKDRHLADKEILEGVYNGPTDGALEFGSRTNIWQAPELAPAPAPAPAPDVRQQKQQQSDGNNDSSESHSYPPSKAGTPTSAVTNVSAPTNTSVSAQSQITKFILQPNPHASVSSLISRALSAFRHNLSFILSPVIPTTQETPSGTTSNAAHSTSELLPHQLLSFVEAPHSSFATSSAVMTINEGMAAQLGVEATFWITVALAYWEFLGERESYILSANG